MPECDVPATIIVAEGLIESATIVRTIKQNRPPRPTIDNTGSHRELRKRAAQSLAGIGVRKPSPQT
jgi:hypothetical protein